MLVASEKGQEEEWTARGPHALRAPPSPPPSPPRDSPFLSLIHEYDFLQTKVFLLFF